MTDREREMNDYLYETYNMYNSRYKDAQGSLKYYTDMCEKWDFTRKRFRDGGLLFEGENVIFIRDKIIKYRELKDDAEKRYERATQDITEFVKILGYGFEEGYLIKIV